MCHEISHMGQYRSGGPGRVGLIELLNDKSLAGPCKDGYSSHVQEAHMAPKWRQNASEGTPRL